MAQIETVNNSYALLSHTNLICSSLYKVISDNLKVNTVYISDDWTLFYLSYYLNACSYTKPFFLVENK